MKLRHELQVSLHASFSFANDNLALIASLRHRYRSKNSQAPALHLRNSESSVVE